MAQGGPLVFERGSYAIEFHAYEEVPRELATRMIKEHKAAKQAVSQ